MNIIFCDLFGEAKNGEAELLVRIKHIFELAGHILYIADRDGYIRNDCVNKGKHIEEINADFLFTCNIPEYNSIVIPDIFSVFMHWAPMGFHASFQARMMVHMFHAYDFFSYSCEEAALNHILGNPPTKMPLTGTSVPSDYVIPPKRMKGRKLFYIGVNVERAIDSMRYGKLLKDLDRKGMLDIYGPIKVYGKENLWAGFDSYRGEIPFDGFSVLQKISQAGVSLALNSPMHNDVNAVTARTYEGAAAGAVLISDDNEFVHKYFGDSVFYINRDSSEEESAAKIMEILKWVNDHPDESYEMACRSQEMFLKKLTLDHMFDNFIKSTTNAIAQVHDRGLQTDIIDVICFLDTEEDYACIFEQLKKQYYQNLHLILICDRDLLQKLDIVYPYDFVLSGRENKGESFARAIPLLCGQFFMFIDKNTVMHARHIYKNHQVLGSRDELFVYSGCYLRKTSRDGKRYIVMNNKPILRDEFLLFSASSGENTDWYYRDRQSFYIETIFSRSAALFKHEILDYVETDELLTISDNVHMYLACCSLIKANRSGRFSYALTSGYWGGSVAETEQRVFGYARRHWLSNHRAAKTYIREFNEVFFKYNFECNPDDVRLRYRNYDGEWTWFNELPPPPPPPPPVSWKRRFVRFLKKLIPKPIKEFIKKCEYA